MKFGDRTQHYAFTPTSITGGVRSLFAVLYRRACMRSPASLRLVPCVVWWCPSVCRVVVSSFCVLMVVDLLHSFVRVLCGGFSCCVLMVGDVCRSSLAVLAYDSALFRLCSKFLAFSSKHD